MLFKNKPQLAFCVTKKKKPAQLGMSVWETAYGMINFTEKHKKEFEVCD